MALLNRLRMELAMEGNFGFDEISSKACRVQGSRLDDSRVPSQRRAYLYI